MIVFANAKINIGLNITSKRPDGFHEIKSCFYPIQWSDIIEIIPSSEYQFSSSGIPIPDAASVNLCSKAFDLLKAQYNIPNVKIHLHKIIPIGAGLGGGSSDAAYVLKALNTLFNLKINNHELEKLAKQIGSDCPFFIENKPTYAIGTGTDFQPDLLPNLNQYTIVCIYPKFGISTKEAYSKVVPKESSIHLPLVIKEPIEQWKDKILNDFEDGLFISYPELLSIKEKLYDLGALYASMSGSGSTMYGIFDTTPILPKEWESNYLIYLSKEM
jgi:4-diphosphocytidyl-2-C-methyl-D-erythritol kinase